MSQEALRITLIGVFLLLGFFAYVLGPRLRVPRVTLLLVIGALCGPAVLDLVPQDVADWFPFVAQMSLGMVGFLLGESFVGRELKRRGRTVLFVSVGETVCASLCVLVAVLATGAPPALALLLAGIAPASAPAAILETVREDKAHGPLTKTVLGVVAIDDAWGVILFVLLLVPAGALAGGTFHAGELWRGLWDVAGALALGGALGLPMAWISGRVRDGEPALVEAIGFVFLTSGLASGLGVSYLLAAMALGATVANRAQHHTRPFHAIEGVMEPFLAVFFLLAGFRFELSALTGLGVVGIVYVVARAVGKFSGAWFGARLARAPAVVRQRVGFCLLPQAGVALGLALLVHERFPQLGKDVLPLVIATTILYELAGPIVTHWQLRAAQET